MPNSVKKPKWNPTPMQICAINTLDKTLLISAAAGSGKTQTLTKRIIKRITKNNADISKMLIVTFTRAAAAELRTRIYEAISEELVKNPKNTQLSNQLTKLNNAKISTIDSFYFDLLKSNFTEAGVSPTFRIIDESEYKLLSKKIMNEAIDELYKTENFPLFIECFTSIKGSKKLDETFLTVHSSLSKIPSGIEYINEYAQKLSAQANIEFFESDCGKVLKARTVEFFKHYKVKLEYACNIAQNDADLSIKYYPALKDDIDFCNTILNILNSDNCMYEKVKACFEAFSPTKFKNASTKTPDSVFVKAIRDKFKEKNADFYENFYSSTTQTIANAMQETALHTATLYSLLKFFNERMDEQKKKLDVLTFNDVSRKTYDLLVKNGSPTPLAEKLSLEYTDIYIDEYQDVDRLQDDIFKAISTPKNRFMVGDIKQSIYKFRGADPSLFSEYRKAFPSIDQAKNSNNATIIMSNNFRCDKNIIDFTNLICAPLFKNAGGCIQYEPGDDLVFTKTNPPEHVEKNISITSIYVPAKKSKQANTTDEETDYIKMEWESEVVASKIKNLINEGEKPGDITVLFRNKRISPHISEALRKRGIKVSEIETTKYFESANVLMMLCILNSIDNPERDVYLAGALRSPIFNFTNDELLTLRRLYPEPYSLYGGLCEYLKEGKGDELAKKCAVFQEKLLFWQENSTSISIDRFLLMLFNDDTIISSGIIANQDEDGEDGNLILLYDYARSFQGSGFKGLYEFIEYINTLISENEGLPATSKSKSEERVSLMSIHKAKGLEFPICFVTSCGKAFNNEEAKKSLILNYPLGLAMKLSAPTGFAQVDTPMREILIKEALRNNAEEEIRTLYVALTRAVNRLFIIGSSNSLPETLKTKAAINAISKDEYTTLCASTSYLDWIFLSLEGTSPEYVDIEFITPEDIKMVNSNQPSLDSCTQSSCNYNRKKCAEKRSKKLKNKCYANYYKNLSKRFANAFKFEYDYSALSKIPAKLSVSQLYPDMLDENDTSLDLSKKEKPARIPDFFLGASDNVSAAERGTATHLFFQFCNFEYALKHGIDEELARLCNLKFIPTNTVDLIYKSELESFLHSDLIKKISVAKRIIREQRFNINLPAIKFVKNKEKNENDSFINQLKDEALTVQGVIDLILIDQDGNIELFDYKTDRLSPKELENPVLAKEKLNNVHSTQLSYYAKAIEMIFGKKCANVQIYSTHSGMLYDVDVKDFFDEII